MQKPFYFAMPHLRETWASTLLFLLTRLLQELLASPQDVPHKEYNFAFFSSDLI